MNATKSDYIAGDRRCVIRFFVDSVSIPSCRGINPLVPSYNGRVLCPHQVASNEHAANLLMNKFRLTQFTLSATGIEKIKFIILCEKPFIIIVVQSNNELFRYTRRSGLDFRCSSNHDLYFTFSFFYPEMSKNQVVLLLRNTSVTREMVTRIRIKLIETTKRKIRREELEMEKGRRKGEKEKKTESTVILIMINIKRRNERRRKRRRRSL